MEKVQRIEDIDPNKLYEEAISIASMLEDTLLTLQEIVDNEELSDELYNRMMEANDLTGSISDLQAYFPVKNRMKKKKEVK